MPFEKGKSGNPGGRPKMAPEVREAFERMTPRAAAVVEQLLESQDEDMRLRAAQVVFDRHLGKAAQPLEHSGPEGEPVTVNIRFVESDGDGRPKR